MRTLLLLFACSAIFLNSCAPLYFPTTINTHQLKKKNDLLLSGHTGVNTFDGIATYAATGSLAVTASYSHSNQTPAENSFQYHKHDFADGGLGWYTSLGESGVYIVFGGYGRGSAEAGDNFSLLDTNIVVLTGTYDRLFVQQGFGFRSNSFEAIVSTRLSKVRFTDHRSIKGIYTPPAEQKLSGWFFEPGVTAKLGPPSLKIVLQAGISVRMTDNLMFDYQPLMMSIGAEIAFRSGNE
jgi:hypothetical protein